jgi:hypothetical protein
MSETPISKIGIGSFIAPIHRAAASLDWDPRGFLHLDTESYVHAQVSPVDGNPATHVFRVTGGTSEYPKEMTAEFRGSRHSRGIFEAYLIGGEPRIWIDKPTKGRHQIFGTLTVS